MPHAFARNALIVATLAATLPSISFAQSGAAAVPVAASTSDIETSKYSFVGDVNADGTLVRSGPSENDYQVLKLNKGQRVTVVGMRFDWLKIVPPDGAFCLVSQAFIDKGGDGTTGRVINKGASVRIGSQLTQAMHRVLPRQLDPGETVKIIGETSQQEFYKIVPPKDVFMYVDKKFVIPVQRTDAGAAGAAGAGGVAGAAGPAGVAGSPKASGVSGATEVAGASAREGSSATTVQPKPGDQTPVPAGAEDPKKFVVRSELPNEGAGAVASAEASAATVRALQEKLSKLEDRYAAAGQDELSKQPLDELAKDYETLLADKQLPPNARKVAEYRASQIKLRKDALAEMAAAKKTQEEAAQKQRDLKAEQDELAARVAATQVKHYAAVGLLLPSSLQVSGQPMYRLIDPATRRLIIYVRAGKIPVNEGLDKFIAINGQVVQDDAMRMTYVQPEAFELADPKQLNTKIFADYAPPSMATANVAGQASAQ